MKKPFGMLLIVLVAALMAGFLGYSRHLNDLQAGLTDVEEGQSNLKYHFVLVADDIGDSFWQSVAKGARQAGQQYGAAVECVGPMIQDPGAELNCLDKAVASRVDGIAVYASDSQRFTPIIDEAVRHGIPVLTVESDDEASQRLAFVGPSSYLAGYNEGILVREAAGDNCNVAIIAGGNYAGNETARNALLDGFSASIRSFSGIKVTTMQLANTGYFSAERIIRSILTDHPDVNVVVCTGTDDTLEVVQVLIDLNRESAVDVIGYGNTPQIRDYIKNDDIYGSVYENPEQTGYHSIETLVHSLQGDAVPDFIDTGISTITRSNLVSFAPGS